MTLLGQELLNYLSKIVPHASDKLHAQKNGACHHSRPNYTVKKGKRHSGWGRECR
jgi:hypothetical protein